jgi:PAS domain S-box-containing protein
MQDIADYAAILQGMPQPYLVLDADLVIVGASDAYLALTSRTRDDIVGRNILEAFPENPDAAGTVEQGPLEVSLRHVLATGKPHEMAVIQYDIPNPDGGFAQKFWTPVHNPVTGADGKVGYIIQNPMDVTESVLKAREADARLRVALLAADLASWEYEPETDIWRRSQAVDELFGFEPGQGGSVAAPYFARIHPEDIGKVKDVVRSAIERPDRTTTDFDYRIVRPSGDVRYVASRGEVLRTSNGKSRLIGVLMDVTADREREAALASALEAQKDLLQQKEQLLIEVNHRVKNSLQLVASTLRLHLRRLHFPLTLEAFEEAIRRVQAIISVHERLYRDDNALKVDMAAHLEKLSLDIAGGSERAKVTVDADPLELSPERAIPVSVILNELLSAAVRQGGDEIAVALKQATDGGLSLSVAFPGSKPTLTMTDLGLKLVSTMAAQVEGSLESQVEGGRTRAILRFHGDAT